MAYNFPSNPTLNQTYSYNGRVFIWNGVQWTAIRTATSTAVPVFVSATAPLNPKIGALWYNTNNQVLYIRALGSTGVAEWIPLTQSQVPPASVFVSVSPPPNPVEGELWFNPSNAELKVWVNTYGSPEWVLISSGGPVPQPINVTVSATAPVDPEVGELWFNTIDANLYVYVSDPGGGDWVIANSNTLPTQSAPVTVSSTEPPSPMEGDLWFNPVNNELKVWVTSPGGDNWELINQTNPNPITADVVISATAPLGVDPGALWYNSIDLNLYILVDDPGGDYWTLANPYNIPPEAPTIQVSSTPPANPIEGSLWYNNTNSDFNIWYVDLNGGQWVSVVPYPLNTISDQGGIFYGPIYAEYAIPDDPRAFITVGWFEDNLGNYLSTDLLTAKGALITATAPSTPATLTVGEDGSFLKADSDLNEGIGWSNLVDCGDY